MIYTSKTAAIKLGLEKRQLTRLLAKAGMRPSRMGTRSIHLLSERDIVTLGKLKAERPPVTS